MSEKLRIAVADDELDMREFLHEVLTRRGHNVVVVASDGRELVERCERESPDLAIVDIRMPVLNGLEAARRICEVRPIPIIVVSAYHDDPSVEEARASHAFAYLVKPIRESELAPAITLAMQRFDEFRALRNEAADLRQSLEDRKTIERAKGILMKHAGLDEPAAFRRLQQIASSKRRKLVDIAKMIVETAEALSPRTPDGRAPPAH